MSCGYFIIRRCGYFIMPCSYFIMSRCYLLYLVVSSLCLLVSSLCLMVTSLCGLFTMWCGLFIMWCGFVFMFCWLHFRYKALVPRLYSLLGTSQTGFKRGLSSCSSALSKITKWWDEGRKHHEEYSEGPQTRVSYFEICCQKNWAWKCISELSDYELVRLGVTTIEDRHRLRALCANTEKKNISLWLHLLFAISGRSGSSRRGGRGEKWEVSSTRVGQ